MYNADTELLEKSSRLLNICTACDPIRLFADDNQAPVDSEGMPEMKQISDYAKDNGAVFIIDNQKTCAKERFVARLKQSRGINQECIPSICHSARPFLKASKPWKNSVSQIALPARRGLSLKRWFRSVKWVESATFMSSAEL
jgi:hypothetical protein